MLDQDNYDKSIAFMFRDDLLKKLANIIDEKLRNIDNYHDKDCYKMELCRFHFHN